MYKLFSNYTFCLSQFLSSLVPLSIFPLSSRLCRISQYFVATTLLSVSLYPVISPHLIQQNVLQQLSLYSSSSLSLSLSSHLTFPLQNISQQPPLVSISLHFSLCLVLPNPVLFLLVVSQTLSHLIFRVYPATNGNASLAEATAVFTAA